MHFKHVKKKWCCNDCGDYSTKRSNAIILFYLATRKMVSLSTNKLWISQLFYIIKLNTAGQLLQFHQAVHQILSLWLLYYCKFTIFHLCVHLYLCFLICKIHYHFNFSYCSCNIMAIVIPFICLYHHHHHQPYHETNQWYKLYELIDYYYL